MGEYRMSNSALHSFSNKRRIYKKILLFVCLLAYAAVNPMVGEPAGRRAVESRRHEDSTHRKKVELWKPGDIRSRDLYFGRGGKAHAPHSTFTFFNEDMNGTNPKIHVVDEHGVKWRVKMGAEARPETAASRLLWAVGYSTNEFYYLPTLNVADLPSHLRRGQNLVSPGGILHHVDMKRLENDDDKTGVWSWRHNPFSGTREFNGLRVMMALLNNWDLKDENNAIYKVEQPGGKAEVYRVSDLGASFGHAGASWRVVMRRGGVRAYARSRFITKVTADYVDFNNPTRPALIYIFNPPGLISRLRMRWIGRHIPRADARWIGQLLAQLSDEQIRDAFRASGYRREEVEEYARVIEERIGELNEL